MIDNEGIKVWRINYGLDQRSPEDAGRWWNEKNNGMAPAGAVAALGLCLDEIERLRLALQRIADHHDDQMEAWAGIEDYDNQKYHEERRNVALFQLYVHASDAAGRGEVER